KEYAHIADYFNSELDTLLDIGCGTGLELEAIYRRFPNASVTGIDLSKNMLEKLNEKYKNKEIELILADYFEYDF
ncbi:class I SAM-dependent methyltransferase, partial [Escherichia coli]|nr:class I SAM-dependent methyltransferase [Escherichia coli]